MWYHSHALSFAFFALQVLSTDNSAAAAIWQKWMECFSRSSKGLKSAFYIFNICVFSNDFTPFFLGIISVYVPLRELVKTSSILPFRRFHSSAVTSCCVLTLAVAQILMEGKAVKGLWLVVAGCLALACCWHASQGFPPGWPWLVLHAAG